MIVHPRLRSAIASVGVLLVLSGGLMFISPALRERMAQVSDSRNEQLAASKQIVSKAMTSSGATAMWYAGNNTYLVVLCIAAGLLFFLMIRA
jgi:hypothetical protein